MLSGRQATTYVVHIQLHVWATGNISHDGRIIGVQKAFTKINLFKPPPLLLVGLLIKLLQLQHIP